MNGNQQISIFGGSFNPITKGHVEIAKTVLDQTEIDCVWITPCYGHTQKNLLADSNHRLEMCKLATQGINNVVVFDFEIENKLSSGTYDFITKLTEDNELSYERDFSYIIGMDNVKIFDTWIKHEELKKIVKFITVPRPGFKPLMDSTWYRHYPHTCLNKPKIHMSSTRVRSLLRAWWKGIPIIKPILKCLILKKIDAKVFQYIENNNLYQ